MNLTPTRFFNLIKPIYLLLTMLVFMQVSHAAERAASKTNVEKLAAQVQRLQDIEEIRVLLDQYMQLLGTRNWEAYAQLFAKDAELHLAEGVLKGPDAIRARMERSTQGNPRLAARSAGLLSNVRIEVNGDEATSVCRWTSLGEGEDKRPTVRGTGRYEDALSRENGRWKFKRRTVVWDIPEQPGGSTK